MKTKQVRTAETARKKRAAVELARGTRFWSNLRDSLAQSRMRGITLAEAKRRLAERLAEDGSAPIGKPALGTGRRRPRSSGRGRGTARRAPRRQP